jgi:hypothetical protein
MQAFWLYNTYIDSKERTMRYTLITKTGRVYTFYVLALAETYQQAYGGELITADILVDNTAQSVYN